MLSPLDSHFMGCCIPVQGQVVDLEKLSIDQPKDGIPVWQKRTISQAHQRQVWYYSATKEAGADQRTSLTKPAG